MGLPQQYSANEAFRRLFLLMRDRDLTDDTPEKYAADRAWQQSLSDIVELCQNSYPSVTGTIPYGLRAQVGNIQDAHTVLHAPGSAVNKREYRWVSGTFTVTTSDEVILCGIGGFTGTMFTVVDNAGLQVDIKNAGTGTVQVNGLGSEVIDGSSVALAQYDSATLFTDGTSWHII